MKLKSVLGLIIIAATVGCNSNVDFKKTKGGMPYKLYSSKSGDSVQAGNIIKLHYIQKVKDSVVFSTYESMPIYFPVSDQTNPYDISEILPMLKKGDSVYAVQLMDTFMARNPMSVPPHFKKGDEITTTIKILDVFKDQQAAMQDEEKEKQAISKNEEPKVKEYLAKNNIQAQRVGTGTYVEIIEPGNGEQIAPGDYVTVNYTGKTFGGTVFDSNVDSSFGHVEPMGFTVGSQGMIKGFDEGIQALKKGSKARVFIPSMLAYGPQPPSPKIKPFEHLIFEIEVLDVKDTPPVQDQVSPPPPKQQ